MGLNVRVDASNKFLNALEGISEPEEKRKIIGKIFIDVFNLEAKKSERGQMAWSRHNISRRNRVKSQSMALQRQSKSHHNVGSTEQMN